MVREGLRKENHNRKRAGLDSRGEVLSSQIEVGTEPNPYSTTPSSSVIHTRTVATVFVLHPVSYRCVSKAAQVNLHHQLQAMRPAWRKYRLVRPPAASPDDS